MCESPGNAARIAALSADQAPTAIIGLRGDLGMVGGLWTTPGRQSFGHKAVLTTRAVFGQALR
jgi:hypothetical protein